MSKDNYLWDAQAARQVEMKGLTNYYDKNKEHFQGIANKLWAIIKSNSDKPQFLKEDDLYEPLVGVLIRDSTVEHIFDKCGLPYGEARNSARWMCYFTHYVVEQLYQNLNKEEQK
jgi:hypothetical protein